MLRIPHCLDNWLTDGDKVVGPTHPPHFAPQKHYFFMFLVLISVRGWVDVYKRNEPWRSKLHITHIRRLSNPECPLFKPLCLSVWNIDTPRKRGSRFPLNRTLKNLNKLSSNLNFEFDRTNLATNFSTNMNTIIRFELHIAMVIKSSISYGISSCSPVEASPTFRRNILPPFLE
jgi:hypothetical protein